MFTKSKKYPIIKDIPLLLGACTTFSKAEGVVFLSGEKIMENLEKLSSIKELYHEK